MFKTGGRVRISMYASPFWKNCMPQITQDVSWITSVFSKKQPTYTKKINGMRKNVVNFVKMSWSKSFSNGFVYNRVGFYCICTNYPRQYTQLLLHYFVPEQLNLELQWEVAFLEISCHHCTKMLQRGCWCFFDKENFQCRQKFKIWKSVCTFLIQILLKPWTLSFKKDTITAKMVSQLKCLEERNNLRFILQRDDLVLLFSWTWGTSSKVMMAMSEEQCWREKDHTNQFMLTTLLAYTLSWYTKIWSTTILLGTRKFFVALLSIYF